MYVPHVSPPPAYLFACRYLDAMGSMHGHGSSHAARPELVIIRWWLMPPPVARLATPSRLSCHALQAVALRAMPARTPPPRAGALPMGPAGFALPLIIYAMTMTSLRLGFGATGVTRGAAGGPGAPEGTLGEQQGPAHAPPLSSTPSAPANSAPASDGLRGCCGVHLAASSTHNCTRTRPATLRHQMQCICPSHVVRRYCPSYQSRLRVRASNARRRPSGVDPVCPACAGPLDL